MEPCKAAPKLVAQCTDARLRRTSKLRLTQPMAEALGSRRICPRRPAPEMARGRRQVIQRRLGAGSLGDVRFQQILRPAVVQLCQGPGHVGKPCGAR